MGTKIFDGLALNVPLLATIPEGEASGIVSKYSPESYLVGTQDPEKVASAILDAIDQREHRKQKEASPSPDFLNDFSREATTKQLMKIIDHHLYRSPQPQCAAKTACSIKERRS